MRFASIVLLVVLCSSAAIAQNDALQGLSSVSQERARLEATRQRESANYDAQEAQCYQRFAVNSCLSKVQSQRRTMLADIRRQEQVLNDAERMQRGAAQIKLNEEKALEKAQKDLDAARTDNAAAIAERKNAQEEKQLNHAGIAQGASSAPRTKNSGAAVDSANARAEYERKQQEATKRRLEAEKRQSDKAASTASKPLKPLPTPP